MELREKLQTMRTADKRSIEELESLFIPVNFRKGVIIGSPEHFYPILHFIENGLVVGNYLFDNQEQASWISNGGFIPPIGGYFLKHPFPEFIQVIEDTKAWHLNLARAELQAQKNHHLYRMLIEIYEEYNLFIKETEMLLRVTNAYDRFTKFMTKSGEFKYHLKNSLLANLLGINEKHLFKLKKKYAKSK